MGDDICRRPRKRGTRLKQAFHPVEARSKGSFCNDGMLAVFVRRPVRARPPARAIDGEAGFTLIELAITMAIFGVLTAIAVPSWRGYQNSQALAGSTRDLVSVMRHAQASAVGRATTSRVDFAANGKSATEYVANAAGTFAQVRQVTFPAPIIIASYSFTARAGGASTSLYFYSRGTATSGTVRLTRSTSGARVITVEGVTGRVSYT
jgi:prepilin-type N-terminal cleavage/methylation domain-containing protein